MFIKISPWLLVFFCALNSALVAGQENTPAPSDEVEEVLVVGEQPGPGVWKISKGEHVLWVMGTLSPLPKNIQWRSGQVETLLANSQELLMPAEVKMQISFWGKVGVLPALIGVKNNPDGKTLAEILPANLYQRWEHLQQKYMEHDKSIEKQRPIFVAHELFNKATEKSGLVPNDFVRWRIEQIVRDNKIATVRPLVERELKNPSSFVKKFKKSSLDDTECFAKTLERLETDLDSMRARANAWATGDIDALRKLPYADNAGACSAAIIDSSFAQAEGLSDLNIELRTAWLCAAELALTNNASTFALLPMSELLSPDGLVAKLQAKGYSLDINP